MRLTGADASPLKAAWDVFPDYSHTCVDLSHFFVSMGVINTCTDFFCTVLPALIVMRLQMPFRRRLAVASVFIIGISVNIASALRIYYLYTSRDTWDFFACTITATFEIGLGLVRRVSRALLPPVPRELLANRPRSTAVRQRSGSAPPVYAVRELLQIPRPDARGGERGRPHHRHVTVGAD